MDESFANAVAQKKKDKSLTWLPYLPNEAKLDIQEIYERLDVDSKGYITQQELHAALNLALGKQLSPETVRILAARMDITTRHGNHISHNDFLEYMAMKLLIAESYDDLLRTEQGPLMKEVGYKLYELLSIFKRKQMLKDAMTGGDGIARLLHLTNVPQAHRTRRKGQPGTDLRSESGSSAPPPSSARSRRGGSGSSSTGTSASPSSTGGRGHHPQNGGTATPRLGAPGDEDPDPASIPALRSPSSRSVLVGGSPSGWNRAHPSRRSRSPSRTGSTPILDEQPSADAEPVHRWRKGMALSAHSDSLALAWAAEDALAEVDGPAGAGAARHAAAEAYSVGHQTVSVRRLSSVTSAISGSQSIPNGAVSGSSPAGGSGGPEAGDGGGGGGSGAGAPKQRARSLSAAAPLLLPRTSLALGGRSASPATHSLGPACQLLATSPSGGLGGWRSPALLAQVLQLEQAGSIDHLLGLDDVHHVSGSTAPPSAAAHQQAQGQHPQHAQQPHPPPPPLQLLPVQAQVQRLHARKPSTSPGVWGPSPQGSGGKVGPRAVSAASTTRPQTYPSRQQPSGVVLRRNSGGDATGRIRSPGLGPAGRASDLDGESGSMGSSHLREVVSTPPLSPPPLPLSLPVSLSTPPLSPQLPQQQPRSEDETRREAGPSLLNALPSASVRPPSPPPGAEDTDAQHLSLRGGSSSSSGSNAGRRGRPQPQPHYSFGAQPALHLEVSAPLELDPVLAKLPEWVRRSIGLPPAAHAHEPEPADHRPAALAPCEPPPLAIACSDPGPGSPAGDGGGGSDTANFDCEDPRQHPAELWCGFGEVFDAAVASGDAAAGAIAPAGPPRLGAGHSPSCSLRQHSPRFVPFGGDAGAVVAEEGEDEAGGSTNSPYATDATLAARESGGVSKLERGGRKQQGMAVPTATPGWADGDAGEDGNLSRDHRHTAEQRISLNVWAPDVNGDPAPPSFAARPGAERPRTANASVVVAAPLVPSSPSLSSPPPSHLWQMPAPVHHRHPHHAAHDPPGADAATSSILGVFSAAQAELLTPAGNPFTPIAGAAPGSGDSPSTAALTPGMLSFRKNVVTWPMGLEPEAEGVAAAAIHTGEAGSCGGGGGFEMTRESLSVWEASVLSQRSSVGHGSLKGVDFEIEEEEEDTAPDSAGANYARLFGSSPRGGLRPSPTPPSSVFRSLSSGRRRESCSCQLKGHAATVPGSEATKPLGVTATAAGSATVSAPATTSGTVAPEGAAAWSGGKGDAESVFAGAAAIARAAAGGGVSRGGSAAAEQLCHHHHQQLDVTTRPSASGGSGEDAIITTANTTTIGTSRSSSSGGGGGGSSTAAGAAVDWRPSRPPFFTGPRPRSAALPPSASEVVAAAEAAAAATMAASTRQPNLWSAEYVVAPAAGGGGGGPDGLGMSPPAVRLNHTTLLRLHNQYGSEVVALAGAALGVGSTSAAARDVATRELLSALTTTTITATRSSADGSRRSAAAAVAAAAAEAGAMRRSNVLGDNGGCCSNGGCTSLRRPLSRPSSAHGSANLHPTPLSMLPSDVIGLGRKLRSQASRHASDTGSAAAASRPSSARSSAATAVGASSPPGCAPSAAAAAATAAWAKQRASFLNAVPRPASARPASAASPRIKTFGSTPIASSAEGVAATISPHHSATPAAGRPHFYQRHPHQQPIGPQTMQPHSSGDIVAATASGLVSASGLVPPSAAGGGEGRPLRALRPASARPPVRHTPPTIISRVRQMCDADVTSCLVASAALQVAPSGAAGAGAGVGIGGSGGSGAVVPRRGQPHARQATPTSPGSAPSAPAALLTQPASALDVQGREAGMAHAAGVVDAAAVAGRVLSATLVPSSSATAGMGAGAAKGRAGNHAEDRRRRLEVMGTGALPSWQGSSGEAVEGASE